MEGNNKLTVPSEQDTVGATEALRQFLAESYPDSPFAQGVLFGSAVPEDES